MSTITPQAIPAGTYSVDPAHSNVGFEVKHMGIATVRGAFRSFTGTIDAGDSLAFNGAAEIASVDTGDTQRDGHLQSPDFFDVEQFPQITFSSASAEADDGNLKVSGEITIKGVTKPIELNGEVAEGGKDPWGNDRIGFELSGVVDRRDFGLSFNQALPTGGLLVANNVKLVISVSAVKA